MNGERIGEPLSVPPEHGMIAPLIVLEIALATYGLVQYVDERLGKAADAVCDYGFATALGITNAGFATGNFVRSRL